MAWSFRVVLLACGLVLTMPCLVAAQGDAEKVRYFTDLQLVQELNETETRLGQLGVSAQYLRSTRPAQTYTVCGQHFSAGTLLRQGNVGTFSSQGQSIYQMTPDYFPPLVRCPSAATVTMTTSLGSCLAC